MNAIESPTFGNSSTAAEADSLTGLQKVPLASGAKLPTSSSIVSDDKLTIPANYTSQDFDANK